MAQYTALLSLGVTGGQVAGGLLVGVPVLSWRAIMVALALLALVALVVSGSVPTSGGDGTGVDVGGAALLVIGLGSVLAGLSLAATGGPRALFLSAIGLVVLLALGAWSMRRERAGRPVMVSPEALAVPAVALGCTAVLVFYTAFTGFLVSWSAYAERFGGPATGSTTFVVPGAVFLPTALQLNRVVGRLGARTPLLGAAVQAVALGALWLAVGTVRSLAALWLIVPLVALMTLGNALMYGPLMPVIMGGVPHDRAGMASGLFATSQQVAMALGSAAFGAYWANATGLAPATAMRVCLAAMLAACAVYAILAQALRRRA